MQADFLWAPCTVLQREEPELPEIKGPEDILRLYTETILLHNTKSLVFMYAFPQKYKFVCDQSL